MVSCATSTPISRQLNAIVRPEFRVMELGFNYLVFGAAPNGRAVRRGSVRFGAHREFSPDVRRDPRTTKPIVNCRRFAVDDRVHGRESEVPCRRRGLTGVQNRRTYSVTERPGLFFFPQKTSIGRCDRKETSENGRKKKYGFFDSRRHVPVFIVHLYDRPDAFATA